MTKARTVLAAVGLTLAVTLVPSLAGAAPAAPPQATLVRTHVFRPAPPAVNAAGKPQPTAANCSPDNPAQYLSTPAYTGSKSTGIDRTAHFNAATTPAGLTTATADLQGAFNTWTATEPAAPGFTVTTAGPVVTRATANRHTDLLFGNAQGAIAITYTWHWSDTNEYESDTVFSNKLAWAEIPTSGIGADGCYESIVKYDLQNIATHEFGHTYGLDHPANDRFATMYAYGYTGETLKRTPATSDTAGIQALYP